MVSKDLLKVIVKPPSIEPVGITPAVTVNGKIATQTQGRGEGIFSDIVNTAAMLYSTVKQPGGTIGASPTMANIVGDSTGTGNKVQDDANNKQDGKFNLLGIPLIGWILIVVGLKVFRII